MKLYPAIDLRGGQAVRLYQGDYDQMTVCGYRPRPGIGDFITARIGDTCMWWTWTAPRMTPPPT